MAVTLNASASAGLVATADTSTILQLQTGGTTAVTVNASQNVGVGTASPAVKLDVVGAISASGLISANNQLKVVNTSNDFGTIQLGTSSSYKFTGGATFSGYRFEVPAGTQYDFFVDGASKVLLNSFGVGLGGASPSSGIGITFPATQSASSDANTLDDYEEGTWTPTITLGVTSPAYLQQVGRYTRIGNLVYVSARCNIDSGTVTGSVLNISLPFTVANNSSSTFPAGSTYFNNAAGNATNARPIAIDNEPTMQFVIQNATGQTAFLGTDYGSGGKVNFTLVYQAA